MDEIDLGRTYDIGKPIEAKSKPQVDYPTLFIRHKSSGKESKMDDMADEGEAVIKYKIRSYKEDLKNDTCECEIDVISIKPMAKKAKKNKSSEESLDEALTNISKKKK